MGIKSDGTILSTLYEDDKIQDWVNIVDISVGEDHSVGLKADGTVVAVSYNSVHGETNVSDWTDIVAISAGDGYTVGLKSDGTVVSTEYVLYQYELSEIDVGQCDVSNWSNIKTP